MRKVSRNWGPQRKEKGEKMRDHFKQAAGAAVVVGMAIWGWASPAAAIAQSGEVLCWHEAYDIGADTLEEKIDQDNEFLANCDSYMYQEGLGVEVGDWFWITESELEDMGVSFDSSVTEDMPEDVPFCCRVRQNVSDQVFKKHVLRNYSSNTINENYRIFEMGVDATPCTTMPQPKVADLAFIVVSQTLTNYMSNVFAGGYWVKPYFERSLVPSRNRTPGYSTNNTQVFNNSTYSEPAESWARIERYHGSALVVAGQLAVFHPSSFSTATNFAEACPRRDDILGHGGDIDSYWTEDGGAVQRINHVFGWKWIVLDLSLLLDDPYCDEDNGYCTGMDFTTGPSTEISTLYVMSQYQGDYPFYDYRTTEDRYDHIGVCAWHHTGSYPFTAGLYPINSTECVRFGVLPVAIE
jgi:hypothetical protein